MTEPAKILKSEEKKIKNRKSDRPVTQPEVAEVSEKSATEPTRMETFAKTGTAAKWSGKYHGTAGFLKRKVGEWSGDSELKDAGRNEEFLGKIHHLVGVFRKAKEEATEKLNKTKTETQAVCRKHGGRFVVVASEFLEDLKNALLK